MKETSPGASAPVGSSVRSGHGEPRGVRGTVHVAARMAVVLLMIGGLLATSTTAAGAASVRVGGSSSVGATSAIAVTGPLPRLSVDCRDGRCTLRLSKQETREMGRGWTPKPTAVARMGLLGVLGVAVAVHRWLALQYANRGWCSGFRLSIYPWESQGYFGYAC